MCVKVIQAHLNRVLQVWMCGGTMEIIPCSNVGHVFRKSSPISGGGFSNYLTTNLNRLSAVWLDEYSFYADKARRIRKVGCHLLCQSVITT